MAEYKNYSGMKSLTMKVFVGSAHCVRRPADGDRRPLFGMKWQDEPQLTGTQLAALAGQAMIACPDRPSVWLGLGRALQQVGRVPEAMELLQVAVARMPTVVQLRVSLARAALVTGAFEHALEQVRAALRMKPDSRDGQLIHFALLYKTEQWNEARGVADSIARINPLEPFLFEVWARDARESGDFSGLLARCEAALATGLVCSNAVYFKALALARLGRDEEARDTLSTERFVEVRDLAIADGPAADETFPEVLANEILANPTLAPDPRGKSTRGGRQTGALGGPEAPAVAALLERVKIAVDAYEARLAAPSGAPGLVRPAMVRLEAWAVVYGAEGQQRPHRHPSSWLSGVYYVSAPRPADETAYQGSLLLGVLPVSEPIAPPWGIREIEPVPGRLILFPSYLPHATTPTGIDGARISVAFDVVPAG